MKCFHVHISVESRLASIRFYSTLFGAEPALVKDDYAKWMLDDLRMNFATSQRGAGVGIDRLGRQPDSDVELGQLTMQLQKAGLATQAERAVARCDARSNKYWVTDPLGITWGALRTLGVLPTFGEPVAKGGCCVPAAKPAQLDIKSVKAATGCRR